MTPESLAEYLRVCRDARLLAVVLKMGGDEVHATFEPDPGPRPDSVDVTPGGWKGPAMLDAGYEEPEQPRSVE